jgi:hypothetical protein
MKAVALIAKYESLEWEFYDEPACLEPQGFEEDWLKEPSNEEARTTKFSNNRTKVQTVKDEDLL